MLTLVQPREDFLGMRLHCLDRALLGLVGVAGVVGTLPLPTPLSMAGCLRSECTPFPTFITRGQAAACYRPTHVALAERRLSPRPVSPLIAVAGVVPVRLSQVVVLTALGRGHPFSIAYVFGRPPTKPCPPGAHCPRPFDFAIVQETVGNTRAAGTGVHLAYGAFMSYGVSGRDGQPSPTRSVRDCYIERWAIAATTGPPHRATRRAGSTVAPRPHASPPFTGPLRRRCRRVGIYSAQTQVATTTET